MENLGIEEYNYDTILPRYHYIFFFISIIFLSCILFKSCKNYEGGQNKLRREYIV